MIALRPYQERTLELLEAALTAGRRKPLLVLPTGAGKTVIACELMRRAVERGQRSLFLAPRRELVTQASRQLASAGVDPMGGLYARVQVGSVDTLLSRLVRRERLVLPEPHLVIADEAHLSITETRKGLLDRWPQALRIGLTATPTRKDGRALGLLYDALIEPTTT